MFDKIKKHSKIKYLGQIRDVRFMGLIVFTILVLLVSWSSISVIQANYDLQKQISRISQQNEVQELENKNLKLRNQHYNTDQYLELAARRQFGKALPGEQLIIVPKAVVLARTVDLPGQSINQNKSGSPRKPTYQKNFEAWMNFFRHRQTASED